MRKENRGTSAADRIVKECEELSGRRNATENCCATGNGQGASICITSVACLVSRESVSSVRVALNRKLVRPRNGRMLSCACICPGLKVSHDWDNMWCIHSLLCGENFRGILCVLFLPAFHRVHL